MNDHRRLTFLTRHYYDLQGLRLAPLWAVGIYSTLIRHPRGPIEAMVMLTVVILLQGIGNWIAIRYYGDHFGWLKPFPPLRTKGKNRLSLFVLVIVIAVSGLSYCLRREPLGVPSLQVATVALTGCVFIALMIKQVSDREHPTPRRVYYCVGAALVGMFGLLDLYYGNLIRGYVAVVSITMLVLGIADHTLLLRLMPTAGKDNTDV